MGGAVPRRQQAFGVVYPGTGRCSRLTRVLCRLQQEPPADGRQYRVRYSTKANPDRYRYNNASGLGCVIDGLRPATTYEFSVQVVKVGRPPVGLTGRARGFFPFLTYAIKLSDGGYI